MAQEEKSMTARERFLESIKEPEYVFVTDEMVAAGLDRLSELPRDEDQAYVVQAIYMAMEYERRSHD
ncbi:MAG: hypothetical protein M3178_05725 [Pseudomonadota bacterium]|nr:hypothetical protein [Pseudomonadota bacterium]